jgi:5-(carboxyamino)imidazole ribonucleotide synthase
MKSLGIVGAGQLGWMMILEGRKLNIEFSVIGSDPQAPASRIADKFYHDKEYREFVDHCDIITPEFEHVDRRILEYAEKQGKLFPDTKSLDLKLERHREKLYLRDIGIPVVDFYVAENASAALSMSEKFDESIIKTSKGGYDGKGQFHAKKGDSTELPGDQVYVVEKFIPFDFEASIIVARTKDGRIFFNQPSYNYNQDGILLYNYAPCDDYGMREKASILVEKLNYVGVMGIEFFIKDGKSIVNEFAPRVHNSGHHTLSGSTISQFEQHIRCLLDLPMHEPGLLTHSGIINVLGREIDDSLAGRILSVPGTLLYNYGKKALPRRKVGHVNVTASSNQELLSRLLEVKRIIYPERV